MCVSDRVVTISMKICILYTAITSFALSFSPPPVSSPFVLTRVPSVLHSSSVCGSDTCFAPSSRQIWDCPRFPVIRLVVAPGLLYGILFMRKLQNRLVEEGMQKKMRVKSTNYQNFLCLSTCTAVVINAALVNLNNTAIMVCAVMELLGWALNLANLLWWSYEYKRSLNATFDSFLLSKRLDHTAPFRKKKSFLQQFKHQISGRRPSVLVTIELSPVKHEKRKMDKKMIKIRQKLAMNMMLGITASLTCLLAYVVSSNPLCCGRRTEAHKMQSKN
jgi:hypothetical protein